MWTLDESKFLTPLEVRHLRRSLAEASGSGGRRAKIRWLVVDLGLSTGLRASEIAHLKVEDLRIGHGQSSLMVRSGKGGKTAPVMFSHALRKHLKDFLAFRGESPGPLLLNERGVSYTRIGIYKLVKQVFRDLGLPERYSPHSLRHTFASCLYRATKDLRLVMKACRHSSPNVTSVYADVLDEEMAAGMEGMYA